MNVTWRVRSNWQRAVLAGPTLILRVGAVIVKDGRIIGEGWHTAYGKLHAERERWRIARKTRRGADQST